MKTVLAIVLLTLYASYSSSLAQQLTISGTATNVVIPDVELIPDNSSEILDISLKSAYIQVDVLTTVITNTFTSINKTLPAFIKLSERDIRLVLIYIECSITVIQYSIDLIINLIFVVQTQIYRIPCFILRILINIINIKINLLLQLISNLQQALNYAIRIGSPFVPLLRQALRLALQRLAEALRLAIYYASLWRRYCVYDIYYYQIDWYVITLQSNLENVLVTQIQTLVDSTIETNYLLLEDENTIVNATQELTIVISAQQSVAQNSSDPKPIIESLGPQLLSVQSQLQQTYDVISKQSSDTGDTGTPAPVALKSFWKKLLHIIRVIIDFIDDLIN